MSIPGTPSGKSEVDMTTAVHPGTPSGKSGVDMSTSVQPRNTVWKKWSGHVHRSPSYRNTVWKNWSGHVHRSPAQEHRLGKVVWICPPQSSP